MQHNFFTTMCGKDFKLNRDGTGTFIFDRCDPYAPPRKVRWTYHSDYTVQTIEIVGFRGKVSWHGYLDNTPLKEWLDDVLFERTVFSDK